MKKFVFYTIIVAINIGIIEAMSYLAYSLTFGSYSSNALQVERVNLVTSLETGAAFRVEDDALGEQKSVVREVLHPYFGYVTDGKKRLPGCAENKPDCFKRIRVDSDGSFPQKRSDRLIVGVLGGSVAVGTINGVVFGGYEDSFAEYPQFAGKEIVVIGMAAGGFRQPQQLMRLSYYYALGAEFDVVINLDGFNDLVIPPSEYKWKKQHPIFPRSWVNRVEATTQSAQLIESLADKRQFDRQRAHRAGLFAKPILRNSATANLIWKIIDNSIASEIGIKNQEIEQLVNISELPKDFRYEGLGPDYAFTSWENLFAYSADMWARSSLMINGIAKANNSRYFHFIQPNQYIEGSKPEMAESERRVAFSKSPGYGNIYSQAFPFLADKKPWLLERGVELTDLTYLYKDEPREIYIDDCCHTNADGYRAMVKAMVKVVAESYKDDE